jgi:hypothetical protein
MKNTCNIPTNGVCCCGTEEKAPENSMDKVRIVKIMAIPVVEFSRQGYKKFWLKINFSKIKLLSFEN